MKTICVFFSEPNAYDYPLDDPSYLRSYTELNDEVQRCGSVMYIVRGLDSYKGNGVFEKAWKIENGQLVALGSVKADVIFDKGTRGNLVTDGSVPMINIPEVNEICTDKWKTYQLFPDYSPLTKYVTSPEELVKAFQVLTTKKVVVKPTDGEGGRGVFVGERDAYYLESVQPKFPLLVQNFLDSSNGIPGIVTTTHDLRIALLDGEFLYSYVRTPPPGGLKANVSQGGTFIVIEKAKIPESFWTVVDYVESFMRRFPSRLYCIDMALTADGPRIIELNSRFGLLENAEHPVFELYKKKLVKKLLSLA